MSPDEQPTFPPLLRGEEVTGGMDPFAKAVASAALGCDPGLVCWARDEQAMRAAIVFAPEEPLVKAMGAVFAVALGVGDAIGALGPPEVALHYLWPDIVKVNGGTCGRLRAAASTTNPAAVPDWLVVGLTVDYAWEGEIDEPGRDPERTVLCEEGCVEVTPLRLLESWSRHTLVWVHRLMAEGFEPLHAAWRERAWRMGEEFEPGAVFLGLDEHGGMILRRGRETELRPLTSMLEDLS